MATITLAGGCFWCIEAVFEQVRAVVSVESGYSNGHDPHPTYESVCAGGSGHAEVVRLSFDPTQINLETILAIFFAVHDPTTLNQQGNDIGEQYRSAVFAEDEEQLEQVRSFIKSLAPSFEQPIVTQSALISNYHRAEEYHQHYFAKNPHQGYCNFAIPPKLAKLQRYFSQYQR